FDATVYLSNDYRDINFAREHNINNIVIIPNGADEDEFEHDLTEDEKRRFRNTYGVGGLVIITVGNYTGEKGHLELLEVFRKLPVTKATLITAGTIKPHDGCFDEFEKQAERINLGRKYIGKRVVMLDGENRKLVRDALKLADMFVFLSNIECSPLVIFESAAAGTPFIATSAGNNKELAEWLQAGIIVKSLPQPNGRVVADKKDALIQVTKLAHNRQKRLKMGDKGKEIWHTKYTWEKLTNDYLKLYQDILGRKK
ncbi:glycosyltransferase family 4 protein, partial [Candidatus Saccharibacteria bacterium]|nr:glycosyltransferase family 4 protein [Candidatus Saccharibacteria bacterium]